MPLVSKGYYPNSAAGHIDKDWELFSQNIELLLQHQQTILACSEYFFCSPSFSYCSCPWTSGNGHLVIGYLLLSWHNRLLVQPCPDSGCSGEVLITSFSGSPFSGANSFAGYCTNCRSRKSGSRTDIPFYELVNFVSKLRQIFPDKVCEQEEYLGQEFSWGDSGLRPIMKTRNLWKPLADPVTLAVLIDELKSNNIRKGKLPNVQLLKNHLKLKLSSNAKNPTIYIT